MPPPTTRRSNTSLYRLNWRTPCTRSHALLSETTRMLTPAAAPPEFERKNRIGTRTGQLHTDGRSIYSKLQLRYLQCQCSPSKLSTKTPPGSQCCIVTRVRTAHSCMRWPRQGSIAGRRVPHG